MYTVVVAAQQKPTVSCISESENRCVDFVVWFSLWVRTSAKHWLILHWLPFSLHNSLLNKLSPRPLTKRKRKETPMSVIHVSPQQRLNIKYSQTNGSECFILTKLWLHARGAAGTTAVQWRRVLVTKECIYFYFHFRSLARTITLSLTIHKSWKKRSTYISTLMCIPYFTEKLFL